MNKKLIASELNQELVVNNDSLGVLSYDSPSGKEEYFVEGPGLNFQTPYLNAEFSYEDLWTEPGDKSFTFAELKFNEEYIGNSTFQKKYIGKELEIKIDNKIYSGSFADNKINLTLKS